MKTISTGTLFQAKKYIQVGHCYHWEKNTTPLPVQALAHCPQGRSVYGKTNLTSNKPSPSYVSLHLSINRGRFCNISIYIWYGTWWSGGFPSPRLLQYSACHFVLPFCCVAFHSQHSTIWKHHSLVCAITKTKGLISTLPHRNITKKKTTSQLCIITLWCSSDQKDAGSARDQKATPGSDLHLLVVEGPGKKRGYCDGCKT